MNRFPKNNTLLWLFTPQKSRCPIRDIQKGIRKMIGKFKQEVINGLILFTKWQWIIKKSVKSVLQRCKRVTPNCKAVYLTSFEVVLVELDIASPQSQVNRDFSNVQYFEEFAARMVDAQLGSIGKRIRTWASFKEDFPDTWHEKLLNELGSLYLFSKAFQNIDRLSEDLQDELLALGWCYYAHK